MACECIAYSLQRVCQVLAWSVHTVIISPCAGKTLEDPGMADDASLSQGGSEEGSPCVTNVIPNFVSFGMANGNVVDRSRMFGYSKNMLTIGKSSFWNGWHRRSWPLQKGFYRLKTCWPFTMLMLFVIVNGDVAVHFKMFGCSAKHNNNSKLSKFRTVGANAGHHSDSFGYNAKHVGHSNPFEVCNCQYKRSWQLEATRP